MFKSQILAYTPRTPLPALTAYPSVTLFVVGLLFS